MYLSFNSPAHDLRHLRLRHAIIIPYTFYTRIYISQIVLYELLNSRKARHFDISNGSVRSLHMSLGYLAPASYLLGLDLPGWLLGSSLGHGYKTKSVYWFAPKCSNYMVTWAPFPRHNSEWEQGSAYALHATCCRGEKLNPTLSQHIWC